jgi:hypothetical protein
MASDHVTRLTPPGSWPLCVGIGDTMKKVKKCRPRLLLQGRLYWWRQLVLNRLDQVIGNVDDDLHTYSTARWKAAVPVHYRSLADGPPVVSEIAAMSLSGRCCRKMRFDFRFLLLGIFFSNEV